MNLIATAHDMKVTLNGVTATIRPGGWPAAIAKVEWFGAGGLLTFADGSQLRFNDESLLFPLVVAWRAAQERQKKRPWYKRWFDFSLPMAF